MRVEVSRCKSRPGWNEEVRAATSGLEIGDCAGGVCGAVCSACELHNDRSTILARPMEQSRLLVEDDDGQVRSTGCSAAQRWSSFSL